MKTNFLKSIYTKMIGVNIIGKLPKQTSSFILECKDTNKCLLKPVKTKHKAAPWNMGNINVKNTFRSDFRKAGALKNINKCMHPKPLNA